jgi:membrane protease YdiL (CAAX protease family)
MSVSSVQQQSFERPAWTVISENISDPKNWIYLIPTIGALALCVFLAPTTAPIGIAAGVTIFSVNALATLVLKVTNLLAEDPDNEYRKTLLEYPILTTLIGPILEEGFFRGLIQPLTTRAILFIAPAAAAALYVGTGLSVAVTISIVATAAIFGLAHAFNEHKNSHIQAVLSTAGGIAFGLLAAQFGLAAAIVAHMVNNTIAMTLTKLLQDRTP